MPYERPGRGQYVTATKITKHNEPCTESGFVGTAVKQRATSATLGLAVQQTIQVNEPFHIRTKGVKEYSTAAGSKGAALSGATLGADVFIKTADNTLALAGGAGTLPFGKVVELPGLAGRSVAPNFIRIDLDQKPAAAA